jgi:hypothetical protein
VVTGATRGLGRVGAHVRDAAPGAWTGVGLLDEDPDAVRKTIEDNGVGSFRVARAFARCWSRPAAASCTGRAAGAP